MLRRLVFIVGFYPVLFVAFVVGGFLSIFALVAFILTGEMPSWPEVGFNLLDSFENWADR